MALRLLVSSATKVVRHSANKLVRPSTTKTGEQFMKCLLANNARACTACKLPQLHFSTSANAMGDSKGPLEVPHDLDGLVGQAKAEIEAFHEGHADPWDWDPANKGQGTRSNPILVPTMLDERVVGCMCEGVDGVDANFILLTWDAPEQRCMECGNMYKLVEGPVYDKIKDFDGEDHYGHGHH